MPDSNSSVLSPSAEPAHTEPYPVWPEAPRLCPAWSLPEYRYIRGLNVRPSQPAPPPARETIEAADPFTQDLWHDSQNYLYGIDLYHQGYYLESREVWEALARRAADDSPERTLLQALMLNSGAQLKAHLGDTRRARRRSHAARWRLARILSRGFDSAEHRFMGLDVADLLDQIRRHYSPMWNQDEDDQVRLEGPAPRLEPQENSATERE